MAEHTGQGYREILISTHEVRVADPDTRYSYQDFITAWRLKAQILDKEFPRLLAYNCCFNVD